MPERSCLLPWDLGWGWGICRWRKQCAAPGPPCSSSGPFSQGGAAAPGMRGPCNPPPSRPKTTDLLTHHRPSGEGSQVWDQQALARPCQPQEANLSSYPHLGALTCPPTPAGPPGPLCPPPDSREAYNWCWRPAAPSKQWPGSWRQCPCGCMEIPTNMAKSSQGRGSGPQHTCPRCMGHFCLTHSKD